MQKNALFLSECGSNNLKIPENKQEKRRAPDRLPAFFKSINYRNPGLGARDPFKILFNSLYKQFF
jgi:hypothetical protein